MKKLKKAFSKFIKSFAKNFNTILSYVFLFVGSAFIIISICEPNENVTFQKMLLHCVSFCVAGIVMIGIAVLLNPKITIYENTDDYYDETSENELLPQTDFESTYLIAKNIIENQKK